MESLPTFRALKFGAHRGLCLGNGVQMVWCLQRQWLITVSLPPFLSAKFQEHRIPDRIALLNKGILSIRRPNGAFQWLKDKLIRKPIHSFIYLLIQQILADCLVSENHNKKLNGDLAEVNQI